MPHPNNLPKITRHRISTAPTDGTIILGYWEDDEDLLPCPIACMDSGEEKHWYAQDKDSNWIECTLPSHWSPFNP